MGVKLQRYYELVEKSGGLPMKMRLAMKTSIPSTKAMSEPDSAENLERFYRAVLEIVGPTAPRL
jgi:hypothetical protein